MITILNADIFQMQVDAIVNPVNCVGVMGKGLAKEFKTRFPENFASYYNWCETGQSSIGNVCITFTNLEFPKYIINFPTKDHWKNPSTIEMIELGMRDFITKTKTLEIKSCAMPQLGCGLGGLNWDDVYPIVKQYLDLLPEVKWYICKL